MAPPFWRYVSLLLLPALTSHQERNEGPLKQHCRTIRGRELALAGNEVSWAFQPIAHSLALISDLSLNCHNSGLCLTTDYSGALGVFLQSY